MTTGSSRIKWLSAGIDEVPADDSWIDTAMAKRFSRMRYTKRISEARLSRWAAKRAVAATLGVRPDPENLRRIFISNAPDGAPEAFFDDKPIGAVIAMTDRADWAVCAILDGGGRVGCDLELVEERSAAFVADYFTEQEQRAVAAAFDARVAANVLWSAKESALKVLRTGLRRDTRTVEVTLQGSKPNGWQPLEVEAADGPVFPGWWIRFGDFVLTFAAERAVPAPVSLEERPGLATAVPSHRWMQDMLRVDPGVLPVAEPPIHRQEPDQL
jgi:4'-phosphopantetheinyl transferase